ncbi:MAG: histidine phosphatase family protein [Nanoarchaeota archaeon]|nr:histidine phosphatase family protein [Nanoarchaeota archaeon]MBU1854556.1 histidine phosphatase family protein [Nanoarchaeota archaeon]
MESDAKIVFSRHGDKDLIHKDIKIIPGSREDKLFVTITPESAKELEQKGKEMFSDASYGNVLLVTSDFLRAQHSAWYFINGVRQNISNEVWCPSELLGVPNPRTDWSRKDMWNADLPVEERIINLFENFYFPERDKEYSAQMANMSSCYVGSIVNSLEFLMAHKNKHEDILAHFTHSPNIDLFMAHILGGCLHVNEEHKVVEVDRTNFPGVVESGEMFTGNIYGLKTGNPVMQITMKGVEKEICYRDLKKLESQLEKHSVMYK